MFAALAAVPFLLLHLGAERLGVLSLVWVLVGYFSFLDMGLGRAVTVTVASCRSGEQADESSQELQIVGTACVLMASVGTSLALVLVAALAGWGVPVRLSSPEMAQEVTQALLWMMPSLPLLLLSSVLRGHLEGVGAFRSLNLLRMPTGVMLVAGPCLTALYSPDLVWACASILLVRLVHLLVLFQLVARVMGFRFLRMIGALMRAARASWLRPLLSFGGWVTVSNVVGPVIVYVDRFVIGAVLAASSVAFYAVPFDVVSRLPVLVASLCAVLLPELARLMRPALAGQESIHRVRRLVRRSGVLSAWVVVAMVAAGWVLAPWALRVWVGADFARQGTQVTQLLLVAFGVNALAQIPFTALQAAGQVRSVALLHVAELLPYGLVLAWAISGWGVEGAALTCLFRNALDCAALSWMWHRHACRLTTDAKN